MYGEPRFAPVDYSAFSPGAGDRLTTELPGIFQIAMCKHAAEPQLLNKSFREKLGTASIVSGAGAFAAPSLRFGGFVLE